MEDTSNLEAARSQQCTEELPRPWYMRLDTLIKEKGISWSRIYNMDESGLQEGKSKAPNGTKVAGRSETGASVAAEGHNMISTSVAALICADGKTYTHNHLEW